MTLITRNSLSDWETYKSNSLNEDAYKLSHSCLDLPNGPYSSLDDAKTEASGILDIYTSVIDSDLYVSSETELSEDKNHLTITNSQKTMLDGHRPLAEAGSPLDTLNVEFNILQYMSDLKAHAKGSWMVNDRAKAGDGSFSSLNDHNDILDRFFTAINVTNESSNYKDSFVALKKTIADPSSATIVHFLNHLNLTFVFDPILSGVDLDSYETYADTFFTASAQEDTWHNNLKSHFVDTSSGYDVTFNWHCRSMYHLVDNYHAMTFSTNSHSDSRSIELKIDLANNFNDFHWDWDSYPGNLYIGNVCKILS